MKKVLMFVLFCVLAVMVGCTTYHAMKDGSILTDQQFDKLPAELKAEQVDEYKAINHEVDQGVKAGLTTGQSVLQAIGPAGEMFAGILAIVSLAWNGIASVKLRKQGTALAVANETQSQTQASLQQVVEGAMITAKNIVTVIGGVTDTWNKFRELQSAGKTKVIAETGVVPIMPDKANVLSTTV